PAYGTRSAWGGPGLDSLDFMENPLGHGWQVDRRSLDASLAQSLRERGVRVRSDSRIAAASWSSERWEIELGGEKATRLRARVLIDATGRAARIARSQGARRRRLDRLVAAYWRLDAPECE